jgi:uroporphyrinogen decarboxylase
LSPNDGNLAWNSYQRVMTALEGGKPDRVPVIPLVREWPAVQLGYSMREILHSTEKHVCSQFYCMKTFSYDIVRDLNATNAETEAMGGKLKFYDMLPPSVKEYVIADYELDLPKLKIFNPYHDGRLPLILEGVRRLKELVAGKVPVDSYIQAPFRLAATLRGANEFYRDLVKRPEQVHKLLEITTLSQIIYGVAAVNAGADIITISDPMSSRIAVTRKQWENFGFIYTKRVVSELKKTGVKIILHICSNTIDRVDTFPQLGVDGLSLGSEVDLAVAREKVGPRVCLLGNVTPSHLLQSSQSEIEEESKECIEKAGRDGAFILSSGCGVPYGTPPKNIKAMVDVAKSYQY